MEIFEKFDSSNNKKFEAQELVYDAWEVPYNKGIKLIKSALKLDPDNVDAYNYLAEYETDKYKRLAIYKYAADLGEKTLGKKFIKENTGYFWGIIETRPYMRALQGLAESLLETGKLHDSIKIYEKMLKLNPNDNQGVRFVLSILLVKLNEFSKFEKLNKEYGLSASGVYAYTYAIYVFKKYGPGEQADNALKYSIEMNPYVIDYLIGEKRIPDLNYLPPYAALGSEEEGMIYAAISKDLWKGTRKAIKWLKEFKNRTDL